MVLRTVTTVLCTGLGTKLLIGFESTTVISAYFRLTEHFQCALISRKKPSSSPVCPATRAARSKPIFYTMISEVARIEQVMDFENA